MPALACRPRFFAKTQNNLAALYATTGRLNEALPLYRAALVIEEKLLGSEHPAIARSLNNLAELYRVQDQFSLAEPL